LKILIFGIKGLPLPAGAEYVVEEVGSRLAAKGHDVFVYVRPHFTPRSENEYRSMKLIHLPSIATKNLDAITHSFLASFAAIGKRPDIIHIHSTGNSIFAFHPRIFGIPTIATSHGLDWKRKKWGKFAQTYLKFTDYSITHFPTTTTAVSLNLQHYYEEKFHRPVIYIPNGVNPAQRERADEIRKLGLKGDDYILFAARLVPEKGAHYLIEAYNTLDNPKKKLIIAGDSIYGDTYAEKLKNNINKNILFPGFVKGKLLRELFSNAYIYVLPSEIEGLSTGLLEAMNYENCVLVSDIKENQEAIGDEGFTFVSRSVEDLRLKLDYLINHPSVVKEYRKMAATSVRDRYDWDNVTKSYEKLYFNSLK